MSSATFSLLRNWIIYRNQTPEEWGTEKAEGLLTGDALGTRGVKEGRGSQGKNFFLVVLKSRVAERGGRCFSVRRGTPNPDGG